jgi:hypothetical protein
LAEELPAGFAGTAARAEGEPAGAGPRPEVLAGAAAGTCLWDGRVSGPEGAAAGTCLWDGRVSGPEGAGAGTCLWDGQVSEPDGAAAGTCF